MTRTEARAAAKKLLKAGFHSPTIMEDVEHKSVTVQAYNRCWNLRTVETTAQLSGLLERESS